MINPAARGFELIVDADERLSMLHATIENLLLKAESYDNLGCEEDADEARAKASDAMREALALRQTTELAARELTQFAKRN